MQHGKFSSKLEVFYTDISEMLESKPKTQIRFDKELDNLMKHVARKASQEVRNGRTLDDAAILKMLTDDKDFTIPKSHLSGSYSKALTAYEKMSNQESRLSKFDFKERVRFLLFRICTAISIAAVILGTAIVAKELGVSLPLSSLKPG